MRTKLANLLSTHDSDNWLNFVDGFGTDYQTEENEQRIEFY